MRREMLTWSLIAVALIGGFVGTVLILNATLYSASGFVRSYLDAVSRHDAAGALELVGPSVAGDASTALLDRSAMGELTDIQLISDTATAAGDHTVVYGYRVGDVEGQSTFSVRPTGTLLGLFTTWAFSTSPLGVIELTVNHDDRFSANGVELITPAQNRATPYLVFTPGLYEFDHETELLRAEEVRVAVTEPSAAVPARLTILPNDLFVDEVSAAVNRFLDECAIQEVLQPTGCPFGQAITNRIVTTPAWSMVTYPDVAIVPGTARSQWLMSQAAATAHLVVDVKSLFDGSVTSLDDDVPFSVGATILMFPDDEIVIAVE